MTSTERDEHDPHPRFREELGAYADGELASERVAALESHLSGCPRCRGELAVQRAMRERCRVEPLEPLPPGLQARLHVALQRLPAPDEARRAPAPDAGAARGRRWRSALVGSGWAVAAATLLFAAFEAATPNPHDELAQEEATMQPRMVEAALVDYRERLGQEWPAPIAIEELEAQVGFPISPLLHAELISAWQTTIRGEPVAALAYRTDRLLFVQYVVSSGLFFRSSLVRAAVDRTGHYVAEQGSTAVVCYPDAQSGSLLVGPAGAERLLALARLH